MHSPKDIIGAIATAPGRGGVGIVRLSGADLSPILDAVLGVEQAGKIRPRQAQLASFRDTNGQVIDKGLVLFFPAPHSYTGENVLELHGHGGPVVLRMLLSRCLSAGSALGARLAEPGEFTQRAYLNDRLDLAQAEAVADLIDAGSAAAARGAMRSLEGGLSKLTDALGHDLTELRALVEACLDFPEEDIEFLRAGDAMGRLATLRTQLASLLDRARQGAILRDGIQLVIAGAPNVGKSSLLNALTQRELAIVSEYAGTTRDRIEARIEIEGIVFNVVDTAGLRETQDPIEKIGINRTREAMQSADLLLVLKDDTEVESAPEALESEWRPDRCPTLTAHNKIDLSGHEAGLHNGVIYVSAKTGAGMDSLRQQLLQLGGWHSSGNESDIYLARERHLNALYAASAYLDSADELSHHGASVLSAHLELFAENLRLAAQAMHSISGAASADELLGEIFSRFCIGK